MIVLPAIERPADAPGKAAKAKPAKTANESELSVKMPEPETTGTTDSGFLPEYHSKTDGLRELLTSIKPLEGDYQRGPFIEQSIAAQPSIEDKMHLPHSRPGLPGAPDLPLEPAGWGRMLVNLTLGLVALFFGGLIYSHFASPTGIDWVKLQTESHKAYQGVTAFLAPAPKAPATPGTVATDTRIASRSSEGPSDGQPLGNDDTRIATTSRLTTTAAAVRIEAPSMDDLMMSPEELEDQIRALEGKMESETIDSQLAKRPAQPQAPATDINAAAVEDDELMIPVGVTIDPEMEKRIFSRASSYLKQRDISSARMILQYAASLGSGVSALALAETYDPVYLRRVNLHDVSGDHKEARKWYRAAAKLGVKEAKQRLASLHIPTRK